MIVFLTIPMAGGARAEPALTAALGADAVARVTPKTFAATPATAQIAIGRLRLRDVLADPRVRLVTTVVNDPSARMLAAWWRAEHDAADRLHALANTFTPAEALELELAPYLARRNLVSRTLQPGADGGKPREMAKALAGLPVLIGHTDHAAAYAERLAAALALKPGRLKPGPFGPALNARPSDGVRPLLQAANARDHTLIEALFPDGGAPVFETATARAAYA